MKMYRITRYSNDIREHEIIKRTPKTVTFSGGISNWTKKEIINREYISCDYQDWFDTWEEANQRLINRSKGKIVFHEKELARYKKTLMMLEERANER